ncbi:uncharacterized protein EI97DRAFT_382968 [Westerdykella ornata]|uniref:Uncharacterized protein n=1 Tax=Westerdykella ornata TaxID=318751 RepID=A0A6A6JCB4_WESOR|nr:uncharacterized protein EI97DRAFT_382968 [Westerdykella ornata]KAF2273638.1 hypothetical protein EI97DRAFT_382968 [Westerdykella ornata]
MPTWGRGGAGNIVSDEQVKQQSERDLEANRAPLSSTTASTSTATAPRTPQQEYAHMGRGGAGNWYQPHELSHSGSFNQTSDSTAAPSATSKPQVSTPWHPEGVELPVARAGRGGAGNFVWKQEEEKRKEEEREEEETRRIEGEVERVVAEGLKMPARAVLGEGRGW